MLNINKTTISYTALSVYLKFIENYELVDLKENNFNKCHHKQLHDANFTENCSERYKNSRRREVSRYYTGNKYMYTVLLNIL